MPTFRLLAVLQPNLKVGKDSEPLCGVMIHKEAPNLDKAYDIVDSLLSVETGFWFIDYNGYGHSNRKAIDKFDDKTLAALGLSKNPKDILNAGKFQIPQPEEFEVRMNPGKCFGMSVTKGGWLASRPVVTPGGAARLLQA